MEIEYVLTALATIVCLITCVSTVDMAVGIKSMISLLDIPAYGNGSSPLVSIIVPACNEEAHIERAMKTLLQQGYENYEIIAVNDRSTDSTGAILEGLSRTDQRLHVLHINELPKGWLGKIHALSQGAAQAKGDYLLFTDADIMMEQTTVARAVERMRSQRLDHLTLLFKNSSPGWLLNSLILDAGYGLCQVLRPWLARKKKSRYFIGVGAFNMVSARAYKVIGGHESIKMHPIDDIMLGKRIKEEGLPQECLLGYDMVTVPWYSDVADMVDGLMKNVLAIIHFRFFLVPACVFTLFCLNILPLLGLLFFGGAVQILFAVTLLVKILAFCGGARLMGISYLIVLGTFISPYITIYIVLKATWRNSRDGGIYWRGTFYSLTELRNNRPLLL